MNNLSSNCGFVDAKIRASDKDLPLDKTSMIFDNTIFSQVKPENKEFFRQIAADTLIWLAAVERLLN